MLKLIILISNLKQTKKINKKADDSEEEDEEGKWKEPEKSWQMKGEVSAGQRGYNTLLEEDLEIASTARPAPEYTDEMTKSLEDIFKKIILESVICVVCLFQNQKCVLIFLLVLYINLCALNIMLLVLGF